MKCYSMQYHFMLKKCKDGFFHMESFKSEIFLGWKIQGFFRILIIEKEKFIFWEFPICWNITGIEFLPIETNYWLIFELFHLGPNSPALNGQIDYQISNKKNFNGLYANLVIIQTVAYYTIGWVSKEKGNLWRCFTDKK